MLSSPFRNNVGMGIPIVLAALLWCVPVSLHAAPLSQLDITSGTISLMYNGSTLFSSNFTQNGTIVMGQYQPPPDIFAPLTVGPYELSLRTVGPNPAPSGDASGITITADLTSLAAVLTGPLIPSNFLINIGGQATGTFDMGTNAFTNLSWSQLLDYNDVLSGHTYQDYLDTGMYGKSLVFSLNGTAAVVPLPGAALLFGTGLLSLASLLRQRFSV